MRLTDLMETEVHTIEPEDTVEQARALMEAQNIRHLVVWKEGVVHGVVSDRDVHTIDVPGQSAQARDYIASTPVSEVMSTPAVTLPPDATVKKAANVMRGRKIGCVVVTEDAKLRGIVTGNDLLEALNSTGTSSKQRPTVRARGDKRRR